MLKALLIVSLSALIVGSAARASAQTSAPATNAPAAPTPTTQPDGAATASAAGGPTTAGTPGNAGNLDNAVTLFGTLNYAYSGSGTGLGIAARYQKRLADRVAIRNHPTIHDDIGIEVGPGYSHYSFSVLNYDLSYNEYSVFVGVVWNFWFNDRFAVYPKAEIGYRFGSFSGNNAFGDPPGFGGVGFDGGGGIIYKLDPVALRAEVGNYDLRLGAALQF